MCTLILARDVFAPRTVLLAANRDERPMRPTAGPEILTSRPRVAGGRDLAAGGTWLAVREDRAAVAVLNRRDPTLSDPPSGRRSRGLLTLDVATAAESADATRDETAEDALARGALEQALRSIARDRYAPFTLVYASPTSCWMLALEASMPRVARIEPGWHVLTHQEMDDPDEPRAAHLLAALGSWRPDSRADAEDFLIDRLRSHGGGGEPPVCLHEGLMATVSSSLVWIDESGARYRHAEGRPCEHAYEDRSMLLAPAESRR